MPSQKADDIYNYLKKYRGIRFSIKHLAKIFECSAKTMSYNLARMYNFKDEKKKAYPGFTRDKEIKTGTGGNDYIRFVYYVK